MASQNPLNFLLVLAIFDGFSLARVVGRVRLEGEPPYPGEASASSLFFCATLWPFCALLRFFFRVDLLCAGSPLRPFAHICVHPRLLERQRCHLEPELSLLIHQLCFGSFVKGVFHKDACVRGYLV